MNTVDSKAQGRARAMKRAMHRLPWLPLAVFASAAVAGLPLVAAEAHVARPKVGGGVAVAEPSDASLASVFEPFEGASPGTVVEGKPGGPVRSEVERFGSAGLAGSFEPAEGIASAAIEPFEGGPLGSLIEGPGGGLWSSVRVIESGSAHAKVMVYWVGRGSAVYKHLIAAGTLQ